MKTLYRNILIGTLGLFLFATGFTTYQKVYNPSLGATNAIPTPIALYGSSLASAITSSATTMTLTSATDKAGTTFASSTYAFVIDGGTSAEEMVLADCTGVTCTNMTRGLSPVTGTTTVASLQFAHRRGASVKITDGPLLLILSRIMNGIGTFPNKLAYTAAQTFTDTTDIVSKAYVDGVAVAGASNADTSTKGIVQMLTGAQAASSTQYGSTGAWGVLGGNLATDTPNTATRASRVLMSDMTGYLKQGWLNLAEAFTFSGPVTMSATTTISGVTYANQYVDYLASTTIAVTAPVPVFVATTTNAIWPSDANLATSTDFLGFIYKNASNNATATVQISGVVSGFTGLTPGLQYYVQDTVGTIGTAVGTSELYVGTAVSATRILLDRKDGNWQYLGSVAFQAVSGNLTGCTANATSTTKLARHFIGRVSSQNGGTPEVYSATLLMSRIGNNSPSSSYTANNGNYSGSAGMSISGDLVTFSGGGSSDAATNYTCSGTLYQYR